MSEWNQDMADAISEGDIKQVLPIIEKGANDWNWGLRRSCVKGYKDIALLMIEKGANDWNLGLGNACFNGHMELANLMIEKGANDWNLGLEWALSGGREDFAVFMIGKGADINMSYRTCNLTNDDILYLIKIGITNFGKYADIAEECKLKLENTRKYLEKFLIKDLTYIVSGY